MHIPGWLQLTAIGLAGLIVAVGLYLTSDRNPGRDPDPYEPF